MGESLDKRVHVFVQAVEEIRRTVRCLLPVSSGLLPPQQLDLELSLAVVVEELVDRQPVFGFASPFPRQPSQPSALGTISSLGTIQLVADLGCVLQDLCSLSRCAGSPALSKVVLTAVGEFLHAARHLLPQCLESLLPLVASAVEQDRGAVAVAGVRAADGCLSALRSLQNHLQETTELTAAEAAVLELETAALRFASATAQWRMSPLRAALLADAAQEDWAGHNSFRRGRVVSYGVSFLVLQLHTALQQASPSCSSPPHVSPIAIAYAEELLVQAVAAVRTLYIIGYSSLAPSRTRHGQVTVDLKFFLCSLAVALDVAGGCDSNTLSARSAACVASLMAELFFTDSPAETVIAALRSGVVSSDGPVDGVVVGAPAISVTALLHFLS